MFLMGRSAGYTLVVIFLLFVLPQVWSYLTYRPPARDWWSASSEPSGLAPNPLANGQAIIQAFAAPAFGWRGAFAVHTWIIYKHAGDDFYERREVIGWGVGDGSSAVRASNGNPDGLWFGAKPRLLLDLRGPRATDLIPKLEAAIASYPYHDSYRVWPGPNSNTFTAYVARQLPELELDLPAKAVGKDFLTNGDIVSSTPSGTGWQLSLFGVSGLTLALKEGIELNLLGFSAGIAVWPPALKLPGVGRLGFPDN